jgi:hypothetical protein
VVVAYYNSPGEKIRANGYPDLVVMYDDVTM